MNPNSRWGGTGGSILTSFRTSASAVVAMNTSSSASLRHYFDYLSQLRLYCEDNPKKVTFMPQKHVDLEHVCL